jgi:hypothetical protein
VEREQAAAWRGEEVAGRLQLASTICGSYMCKGTSEDWSKSVCCYEARDNAAGLLHEQPLLGVL